MDEVRCVRLVQKLLLLSGFAFSPSDQRFLGAGRETKRPSLVLGPGNRQRVQLSWRAASESGITGFNVFRTGPSGTVKVNRGLIAAAGIFGARHRLVDRAGHRGTSDTYRLQIVHLDRRREWSRTARVSMRR
jgi:hypothetical protein